MKIRYFHKQRMLKPKNKNKLYEKYNYSAQRYKKFCKKPQIVVDI